MTTWTATDHGVLVHAPDEGFASFFQAEYPALINTVYLIVRDREHARDIAQEAFIQLFSRWRRISGYDRPDAWVRRVAIRMAVRAVRRQRLVRRAEAQFEPSPSSGPLDLDVLRAVGTLPGAQRAAVTLFYFEDRPIAEIAEILGCSETTVKVHLHRARRRLAESLNDRGSSGDEYGP